MNPLILQPITAFFLSFLKKKVKYNAGCTFVKEYDGQANEAPHPTVRGTSLYVLARLGEPLCCLEQPASHTLDFFLPLFL